MENQEYQNDYSQLYQQLKSDILIREISAIQHPFSFFTLLTTEKIQYSKTDFTQSLTYQNSILKKANHAYDCFFLEMSFLNDKKETYINTIIDYLFEQYELSKNKNIIIAQSIRHLFYKLTESQFNIYIKNNNRYKLSKWHTLKEPIKSFVFKKVYEDKWFEMRIYDEMLGFRGFLSKGTSYKSFKALFTGKYLEKKINWIDNKSSLIYFIKSLISQKVIIHPKNKHWEIVSEFFLIKGEQIAQNELLNQKETRDNAKRLKIDSIVDKLVNYN
ncbi:hypothetical protein [Confluentibacter sediminis]|uniref:hypothetical protein n=1 Tax=Confluentibacter sediminis TaxID=2219045 RepID=UPI000DADD166|nr:hypothetical protein [Confluentibacter sediminis]